MPYCVPKALRGHGLQGLKPSVLLRLSARLKPCPSAPLAKNYSVYLCDTTLEGQLSGAEFRVPGSEFLWPIFEFLISSLDFLDGHWPALSEAEGSLVTVHGSLAEGWWTAWDSNPRPPRCERGALPTELAAHWASIVRICGHCRNCSLKVL